VEIHVLQGERQMAADNRTLGRFHLVGIPSAPRGVPQVEVAFDIDANGILNVSALDKATNKTQNITITASSGLSAEEVEAKVKEAEAHAEEDKDKKARIDMRNQLDSLVYSTEKLLKENREKISEEDAKLVDEALAEGKTALEGDKSVDEMKAALEKINSSSHKLAEQMYKEASAAGQAEGAAGAEEGEKPEGDVVDAEVVDDGDAKESAAE
jgi:molecular chaperone DnaK